ncbi:MAG: phosphoribosyl-ATP diphosphatase [Alphaproteobacteria bacterium]|nr:phosphoribosyl-ATP diphosphatase [Alphaproteobacteria bacterium]
MTDAKKEAVLSRLFAVIESRRGADPESSYTAQLLAEGVDKIAAKLDEETAETILAATQQDRAALVHESADLLYHLLTLLAAKDVTLEEVFDELKRREGTSGIEEKNARRGKA